MHLYAGHADGQFTITPESPSAAVLCRAPTAGYAACGLPEKFAMSLICRAAHSIFRQWDMASLAALAHG